MSTTNIVRNAIVSLLATAFVVVTGCAIDPSGGIAASRGPTGALGARCSCPGSQPDCDGDQGQCNEGLSCMRDDAGNQVCTQGCPCPFNYICKAAGVPGARLSCFKQP
jgi:hypothetical protein